MSSALDSVLDSADERLQGWAYWTFKSFHDITTEAGGASGFCEWAGGSGRAGRSTESIPGRAASPQAGTLAPSGGGRGAQPGKQVEDCA